ncbi:MAG: hypothetical protein ACYDCL_00215 [Myxococcales bacterium]
MTYALDFCAVAAALMVAGCTPPSVVVSGRMMDRNDWADVSRDVMRVASFELQCPPAQLEVTVLMATSMKTAFGRPLDYASQVGVSGCGRQRVYTRSADRWIAGTSAARP